MSNPKKYDHRKPGSREEYPVIACRFTASVEQLETNDDKRTYGHVRLLARSSEPINHWFWGKIAHDNSGAKFGDSIPIDYCHDDKEVIGFALSEDIDTDDDENLYIDGKLTPFLEDDRASEILAKGQQGVPYQASINFGGDGIVLENVAEDETAEVNGYTFEGPGVIVREWPLRGVAICPYGADANTSSEFQNSDGLISLTVVTKENLQMATDDGLKPEDDAVVNDDVDNQDDDAVDNNDDDVEDVSTEPNGDDDQDSDDGPNSVDAAGHEMKKELKRFMSHFGETRGAKLFADDLSFEDAAVECIKEQSEEIKKLSAENDHLKKSDADAVDAPRSDDDRKQQITFTSK